MLDKHGIVFNIEINEQEKEQILDAFHEKAQKSRAVVGSLDLRFIYIDFEDKDYPKIAKELERYGIVSDL